MNELSDIFSQLENVLEARKASDAKDSYVAFLYERGIDQILKKIGEESAETIIAAKNGHKDAIIYEVADLLFHLLVLLRQKDISFQEIGDELARRFGLSGHDEKSSRLSGD